MADMRRSILLLMLVLLPLRVWASDAMALRMVQVDMATLQAAVTAVADQAMPDDCPMMSLATPASDDDHDPSTANAHCTACHLCAAAAADTTHAAQPRPLAGSMPEPAARFLSADARLVLKPPIS